jgi:hypothetical protein
LNAEFNTVQNKIKNGTYANEYQFQADLFRVFNLAHDGHFRFFPDLLTGALSFQRGVGLVSVSLDGKAIPKIYTHDDIVAYIAGNKKISPVKTINGQDAIKYVEDFSQLGALQDPDALYNAMFYSKPFAAASPGFNGYFAEVDDLVSTKFNIATQGLIFRLHLPWAQHDDGVPEWHKSDVAHYEHCYWGL